MASNVDSELASRLATLLAQTESAHGQYEVAALQGQRDEQWPAWYSAYLLQNGLPGLLDGMPGRGNLVNNLERLLVEADKNHRSSATSEPWPSYYARYFLSIASSA